MVENFSLGIELGSTRIKAILINEKCEPVASGSYGWENQLKDGYWTYALEDVWKGIQSAYAELATDVESKFGEKITTLKAIGFSAMMHGYLAFDSSDNLLVPFRTWRNTTTGEAAAELSKELNFNMPQRWSVSHLYQAILSKEEHVPNIDYVLTLAGYVHYKLIGVKAAGVGEASGMFPIDSSTNDYDAAMEKRFDEMTAAKGFGKKLREVFPKVLIAGEAAGNLTAEGAKLLDPTGTLQAGIPLAPCEGDAGTGMVATNSVAVRTGNVSAGTSIFAMVVLENKLKNVHEELDMVTTPDGKAVAMVHCNNCTSDLNAWVGLIGESLKEFGCEVSADELYTKLFMKALDGAKDGGGIISYNYFSGEPVTGFNEGRPIIMRKPDAGLKLADFMRVNLYSCLTTLKVGCDILFKEEQVPCDLLYGHGGFFKTKGVGQGLLAAALNSNVAVMETAGEGGAWGMAVLASYLVNKAADETLPEYLNNKVFAGMKAETVEPNADDVKGFDDFTDSYKRAFPVMKAAVENF